MAMTEIIKIQILGIRDTGKTNMFDTATVKALAKKHGFKELIKYIEENPTGYGNFIMYGDENGKAGGE